jgi:hypothetical protein
MKVAAAVACLGAGLVLGACASAQSPGAALASWSSQNEFSAAVTTLLTDSNVVHVAIMRHESPKAVRTVCVELLDDAQGANDALDTPDAQLTSLLSRSYDHFAHAANACFDGSASPTALGAADRERHVAVGLLVQAVLREEAVVGRSLGVRGIP